MGLPAEVIAGINTELLTSLIDELAQFLRSIDDLSLVLVLLLNRLSNLGVLPRGGQVQLPPSLKLLLSLNQRVEDPFPVLEGDVGSEGACPLVEGLHLLGSESAVEDFEVLAGWEGKYMRELRLLVKRLLLRKRLLARYSLAPLRRLEVR